MSPGLRRNGQLMVLPQQNLLSGNELFEMMRSRQVYYVQKELRKDLDRTLRALKQAEKMQLAGLRIQKAIFLKRKIVMDLRKRRIKNNRVATRNQTLMYSRSQSGNDGSSAVAERKSNGNESSTKTQSNFVALPRQIKDSYGGLRPGGDPPLGKSGKTAQVTHTESTINSEWMRSIQVQLQKLSLQAENGTDNLVLSDNQSGDRPPATGMKNQQYQSETIQTAKRSILNNNSGKSNNICISNNQQENELSKKQYVLPHVKGKNNINERDTREKLKDENKRLCLSEKVLIGKNKTKLELDESAAEIKYFMNVRESVHQIKRNAEFEELSVMNGMQVSSLDNQMSNQQVVETNANKRYSNFPHEKKVPIEHAMPQKGENIYELTRPVDRKDIDLEADIVNGSLVVNKNIKKIQSNSIEEITTKSTVNKETNSKPVNSRNLTEKQMVLSPGVAYLDRSRRLQPEKLSVKLTYQDSKSSRSSSTGTANKVPSERQTREQLSILLADQNSKSQISWPGVAQQDRSKKNTREEVNVMLAEWDMKNSRSSSGLIRRNRSKRLAPENVLLSNLQNKSPRSSPEMTHLDKSKRHIPETRNALLADQDSMNSRSPVGSLERTVTMIFVEDPSVSLQDPPKSHFDIEAWLAYNKRKRGYTKIYDDRSSLVTSDDASTRATATQERKTSLKNQHVRFHFPKRLTLSTLRKPGMLTFREKSKEWYQNFLKKNNRHSQNLQDEMKVRKYVSNQLSYALLPNIGTRPVYKTRDRSRYEHHSSNHVLSRESTGEQLKRLKDDSKRLQKKVHEFVYS